MPLASDFIDLYTELEIPSSADAETIRKALVEARVLVQPKLNFTDTQLWAERMYWVIEQAEAILLNPSRRMQYDAQRAAELGASPEGDDLLWIDPQAPYVFDSSDDDPAYTVPALARKLDSTPDRAIAEVKQEGVEIMLRSVGFGRPNQAHYDQLASQIGALRTTLGERHPRQMLESIVVLCDPTIERPLAGMADEPLDGSTLAEVHTRPDTTLTIPLRLSNIGLRGCLFGYLWLENDWARIVQPAITEARAAGKQRQAVYFELLPERHMDIVIRVTDAQLLALERPGTHLLRIGVRVQPDTAHEHLEACALPVQISKIPAKGVFTPALLTMPTVRRGERVAGLATLINQGEEDLHARLVRISAPDAHVDRSLLTQGDRVEVSIETSQIPFGTRYQRIITFEAVGDIHEPTFRVEGEILPTALQHVLRSQSLADRLTLALAGALLVLAIGPFMLGSLSSVIFWLVWIVFATGMAIGVTSLVARRVVEHVQASGDTSISYAAIPWRPLIGIAAGVTVLTGILVALVPQDDAFKALAYGCVVATIAAAGGFVLKEDFMLFPRRRPDPLGRKSLTEKAVPAASRGMRIGLVIGAMTLVALFIAYFVGIPVVAVLLALGIILVAAVIS